MKQTIKKAAYQFVPLKLLNFFKIQMETIQLKKVRRLTFHTDILLRNTDSRWLEAVFLSPHLDEDWLTIVRDLEPLMITDRACGVNPGDRRAIFYLVRHLRPKTILEIGTHVGASTIHMIAA